eukprot:Lithocolla_globosa_v1_NODE_721_length_3385_cov_11.766967.p2 type:complete len:135 gc:universal NODE_721_length_3385_cov_11.766967:2187-1783(-)
MGISSGMSYDESVADCTESVVGTAVAKGEFVVFVATVDEASWDLWEETEADDLNSCAFWLELLGCAFNGFMFCLTFLTAAIHSAISCRLAATNLYVRCWVTIMKVCFLSVSSKTPSDLVNIITPSAMSSFSVLK